MSLVDYYYKTLLKEVEPELKKLREEESWRLLASVKIDCMESAVRMAGDIMDTLPDDDDGGEFLAIKAR